MAELIHGVPDVVWNEYARTRREWDRSAFDALFGRDSPPDLARWEPEWMYLARPEEIVPRDNAFEAVLESSEDAAILQVFAHAQLLFCAALDGDGDELVAHVPRDPERLCEVAIWSHEKQEIEPPFAFDLAHYAWVERTAMQLRDGTIDVDAAAERIALVSGAVGIEWPLNRAFHAVDEAELWSKVEAARVDRPPGYPGERPPSALMAVQARSRWIVRLLSGQPMYAWMADPAQAPVRGEEAIAHPEFPRYAPSALYWMWRSFFFREEEQLAAVLDRVEGSPSRLIRDAARLVTEVRAGRKQVGRVADVHALRDEWHEALVSEEAKARRVETERRAAQRRTEEAEAARAAVERASYEVKLAGAAAARAEGQIALVGGEGVPRVPKSGSDRDYRGHVPTSLMPHVDYWTQVAPGRVLVIRRGGEILIAADGALHPLDPPLQSAGFAWDLSRDGRSLLVLLDGVQEIDLDTRARRTILSGIGAPSAIVSTHVGFALSSSEVFALYRWAPGGQAREYLSVGIETTDISSLHGGRVLALIGAEGATFLALSDDDFHAMGRTSHPVVSIYEHEGRAYLTAKVGPYDCEIHNLAEAYEAALGRPACEDLSEEMPPIAVIGER